MVCDEGNKKQFFIDKYDYENFVGVSCNTYFPVIQDDLNINWQQLFDKKFHINNKLIDCRSEEQFNIIHFEGYQNIVHLPFSDIDYISDEDLMQKININCKDEEIFVFCRTGRKSIYFVDKIRKKGFKAFNIHQGLKGYKDLTHKNFPLI